MAGQRRTWGQRLLLAVSTLGVFAALGSAAALAFVESSYREITRLTGVEEALAVPALPEGAALAADADPGDAKNFLLVGIDSTEGIDPDSDIHIGRNNEVTRTDTMIVLRIDPDRDEAAMLSIPRDLYVPIAGRTTRSRINSAITLGGPEGRARLIETIEDYFEFDIHHYVEVDFAGFQDLVDELGGVPMYFAYPAKDDESGLDIPEAGCFELDSEQALAYARSRHFRSFVDGEWQVDGSGDLGRNTRQQHFIRQSLRRSVSVTGRNFLNIGELIGAGVESVSVDTGAGNHRHLLELHLALEPRMRRWFTGSEYDGSSSGS